MPAPASRNALCPCGSGKRYKACHGGIEDAASSPGALAAQAQVRLDAKDHDGAVAIAEDLLAQHPEHPDALRILALVAHERGHPEDALPLLLRAARALPRHPLPAAAQYAVWTALNFMFTQALAGLDVARAGTLRADYAAVIAQRSGAGEEPPPLVSVIVVAGAFPERTERAIAAVRAQAYRPLELVLVHDADAAPAASTRAAEGDTALAQRLIGVAPEAGLSVRLNAGVRASCGTFVAILESDHLHAPERIAVLVEAMLARSAAWGFTDARFMDTAGRPVTADADPRVGLLRTLLEAIPESDSVGHALFHHEFVALGASNLFFRRDLFDALDGFRDLPLVHAWDFALRAVWLAEPVHVARPLYVHWLPAEPAVTQVEREQAQVAMFTEHYARVCRAENVPANPIAPCMAVWGLHFLKTPFQTGHVLAFAPDELDRLAALVLERRKATAAEVLTPGLNLVGFAFGEFGLGESLRALAGACDDGGIPFVVKDVDMRLRSRQADRTVAHHVSDVLRHRVSLYCLNPDMLKPVHPLMATTTALGGYNIGYWYWELETLPRSWDDALARVDEIWVATEFVAEAMRRVCDRPVLKVPPPIEVRLARSYRRAEFDLPDDRFLFLFSFDFNSFSKRKNPEAAIAAFRQAFPRERGDVGLVVKSINGMVQPGKLQALMAHAEGDPRVLLRDGFLSRDEVSGLESVVDAYVSLHRAEGLGLGLAESMYLGKPVIGTAYSGNLEFMTPDNSCLVDYRMVPIARGEYLYDDPRFQWADPDVEQGAAWMRRLADDAAFRTRIARAGQETIRGQFNRERTAALMRVRLEVLGVRERPGTPEAGRVVAEAR